MKSYKQATQAIWGGGEDEYLVERATQVPIVQSISYGYSDIDEWQDIALKKKPGHIYSRNMNPTVHAFEEKVRILEGAENAITRFNSVD
jgi:cystathionine gamma-synthase